MVPVAEFRTVVVSASPCKRNDGDAHIRYGITPQSERCTAYLLPTRRPIDGLGGVAISGSAAELGKLIAEETVRWAKVVKAVGIKLQ